MMRRAILAFATLIALSQTATAGVLLFGHVSCAVVRFYVARYSESTAEKWARSQGASGAEIEIARRCLHSATVQTAGLAAKSQLSAAVTEQERAQHKPAERDPDQDAMRVVPVQGQRADPKQDNDHNKPDVHDVTLPKNAANAPAGKVNHEINDPARSDGKTTISRQGAVHQAAKLGVTGRVSWLKRLWTHLVGRHQSRIALFTFSRMRTYKARPLWHHV